MISQMNMNTEQLRRIIISGVISEECAAVFLEQITAYEYIDLTKPISVYVDTFGGSVNSALLMYDAIKACAAPVVTIGIGKVMSAGALLLAAGEPGNRFITENTRVMLHQISGGAFGPISDMEASLSETRNLQEVFYSLLSKDTGVSLSKLMKDIGQHDFYMSATEAVAYGLADKLVPTRRALKKAVKVKTTKK